MKQEWGEDGLVIEGNTIYEIDLDCYECLSEEEKKRYFNRKPCRERPPRKQNIC